MAFWENYEIGVLALSAALVLLRMPVFYNIFTQKFHKIKDAVACFAIVIAKICHVWTSILLVGYFVAMQAFFKKDDAHSGALWIAKK